MFVRMSVTVNTDLICGADWYKFIPRIWMGLICHSGMSFVHGWVCEWDINMTLCVVGWSLNKNEFVDEYNCWPNTRSWLVWVYTKNDCMDEFQYWLDMSWWDEFCTRKSLWMRYKYDLMCGRLDFEQEWLCGSVQILTWYVEMWSWMVWVYNKNDCMDEFKYWPDM